jgi:ribosomal protein S18 acetylase RimI-like enzyme
MYIEPDVWLADILGRDVYRLVCSNDHNADSEAVREVITGARGRSAFYYAKVPTQRVNQVRALCGGGFSVVDVQVTFERAPDGLAGHWTRPGLHVRDITHPDHADVLDIAGNCFRYSRFHLDPFFSPEQANLIKREWVRNCILGQRGERVLVAEMDRVPVGFLAVLAADVNGRSCRVIDLIGVSAATQGRGVGTELVKAFTSAYAGRCEVLRVGTQVANVASVRLYEGCGFRLLESAYVLHAHINERKILR